jgi:hypothetical protein
MVTLTPRVSRLNDIISNGSSETHLHSNSNYDYVGNQGQTVEAATSAVNSNTFNVHSVRSIPSFHGTDCSFQRRFSYQWIFLWVYNPLTVYGRAIVSFFPHDRTNYIHWFDLWSLSFGSIRLSLSLFWVVLSPLDTKLRLKQVFVMVAKTGS